MQIINAPSTGSLRADTFSRNRYGSYVRNRSIPINPQTSKQTTIRNRMTTLTRAWAALASTSKSNWENYATLHPRINSLGEGYVLSGHAQFIATNLLRNAAGLASSNTPPTAPSFVVNTLAAVITLDTTGPTRVFTLAGTNQPAGYRAVVRASPPMGLGRVTPLNMKQVLSGSTAAWGTTPLDLAGAYATVHGQFQLDQRVILDVDLVSDDGEYGGRQRVIADVVDVTP